MRENMQRPVAADYGATVNVHSIFETIQGEGPFCGERALFIRLNGCNLRCPGCDTEYTAHSTIVGPYWMAQQAAERGWVKGALVVITGGEPMRQRIGPSIRALLEAGYTVQIETNGVLWDDTLQDIVYHYGSHQRFQIVCSPKTTRIHERVFTCAAAFKYVLQAGDVSPEDGLPRRALLHPAATGVARPRKGALVYVQPMDEDDSEANLLNLSAAIHSCMTFGHRLQIQVHKLINME